VRQAGSLVSPERLRFDFTHFKALTEEEIERIERMINERIWADYDVYKFETSIDEALEMGAMALFGEKYGERVRVVKVGDFSIELCGGTHVSRTGNIGLFKVVHESAVSAGVRRIEAVCRGAAYEYMLRKERIVRDVDELLKAREGEEAAKIERLYRRIKELEKELERAKSFSASDVIEEIVRNSVEVDDYKVAWGVVDGADMGMLRDMVDQLKKRLKRGVVLVASKTDRGVSMVVGVTSDLIDRFHAGFMVKEVASVVGGGGGGRPDMAQAGGRDASKLDEAIERFKRIAGVKEG